jgi:hypothetical protein
MNKGELERGFFTHGSLPLCPNNGVYGKFSNVRIVNSLYRKGLEASEGGVGVRSDYSESLDSIAPRSHPHPSGFVIYVAASQPAPFASRRRDKQIDAGELLSRKRFAVAATRRVS